MYGRSSELGLYLWGNPPLPPVQGLPPPAGGGWAPDRWVSPTFRSPQAEVHPLVGGSTKCPRPVGGPPPVAIRMSDSPTGRGLTHHPRAVGAPARGAGGDFPRVSNLHLRISVWYSSNWIGSGSIWSHFLTCRHQGRHQAAGEVGLASTSPPRVEKTTKRYSLAQLVHPPPSL